MLIVYLICNLILNKKKPNLKIIIYFIICIISASAVILAPGNYYRAKYLDKVDLYDFSKTFELIGRYISYLFSENKLYLLYIAAILIILLISLKKYTFINILKEILPYIVTAVAGVSALSFTSYFEKRPVIFGEILIIIVFWKIIGMMENLNINEIKKDENIKPFIKMILSFIIGLSAFWIAYVICMMFVIDIIRIFISLLSGISVYILISKLIEKQNLNTLSIDKIKDGCFLIMSFFIKNKRKFFCLAGILSLIFTVYCTVDYTYEVNEMKKISIENYHNYLSDKPLETFSVNSKFYPDAMQNHDMYQWIEECEKYGIIRPETEIYFKN